MEATLNVKAVTKLTGLNQHTLRAWERRYGAVKPKRNETGRRLYSEGDVERLLLIVQLVERGHPIGSLARRTRRELAALLTQSMTIEQRSVASLPNERDTAPVLGSIESALRDYDLALVYQEIQEARFKTSAREFALNVVAPLMVTVGRLIVAETLSIAQEHALSAIVKSHLMDILFSIKQARSGRNDASHVALATMEGDLHEIGILISAVLCAHHGCTVQYIGPNIPPAPLGAALKAMETDLVILGTTPLPPGLVRWQVSAYVAELVKHLPKRHAIWVGGRSDREPSGRDPWRQIRTFEELDTALASGALTRRRQ